MLNIFKKEEPPLTFLQKLKYFMVCHWRGVVCLLVPLIMLCVCIPLESTTKYQWCGYSLLIMAVFWITECIALPVTSFIPLFTFPVCNIMNAMDAVLAYMNSTIIMFLASLFLAASVEQSGLHNRLALCTIRCIGYSHLKLLLALCLVTMFVSMWIANTAATTMMVPIIFALLEVFESNKLLKIYETNADGEKYASDITTVYFCAASYSATIGGIGTLVGTGTNLVFKGLFANTYTTAPDYLTFLNFSAFAVPYMLIMEFTIYFVMSVQYLGLLRPRSKAAKNSKLTKEAMASAKKAVDKKWKDLGPITYWEINVIILFSGCMICFFCRSPQIFTGWGDLLHTHFSLKGKFIKDSSIAILFCMAMMIFPSTLAIFKNCTAKYREDLPKGRVKSILDWNALNASMPWSFMFLLGGGFILSKGSGKDYSDLNGKIGEALGSLKSLPNELVLLLIIIATVFITNFAANIAVCNVVTPIAMRVAQEINRNPLWYNLASGFSASYCFMVPVGTPPNLLVQGAAKIPTTKMILAGTAPTILVILETWVALLVWAPVVWPDLKLSKLPDWTAVTPPPAL